MVRSITDLLGTVWQVWEVHPPQTGQRMLASLRDGWLGFQSHTERRRFAPIPQGWETFSEESLLLLLARSEYAGSTHRASE
jgi:hypothetical protein